MEPKPSIRHWLVPLGSGLALLCLILGVVVAFAPAPLAFAPSDEGYEIGFTDEPQADIEPDYDSHDSEQYYERPWAAHAYYGKTVEYRDPELGIEFSYPEAWGTVVRGVDSLCETGAALRCSSVSIAFSNIQAERGYPSRLTPVPFLYAWGADYAEGGRDGFWGDSAKSVKNASEARAACDAVIPGADGYCESLTSLGGIYVAKHLGHYNIGDNLTLVYEFDPKNPNLKGGIVLSPDDFPIHDIGNARMDDLSFERMVKSIKLISP